MKNLFNPKLLFIINTLPITVLFFLFTSQYGIINSLLGDESRRLWLIFGLLLFVMAVLNFLYALWLTLKKKGVSIRYCAAALVCYITFIYFYTIFMADFFPAEVPRWLIDEHIVLYPGTFLMPTIFYALFSLAVSIRFEPIDKKPWKGFLLAVAIPVLWYLFFTILLPLWQPREGNFFMHTTAVLLVGSTVAFLFFLIKVLYAVISRHMGVLRKYRLVWLIPLALILPLVGLVLNNKPPFAGGAEMSGVFGNFTNYWFYILAVLNGVLICLPNLQNKPYRFILFLARSITFVYTLYFFLVFLPFLPASVLFIIAWGAGFLMLTPLLLFVIHINILSADFIFLKEHFQKYSLAAASVACFLVIPIVITAVYLRDRVVLSRALEYMYTPDYSENYSINKSSVKKTLMNIEINKERRDFFLFPAGTPFLSSYFNWLVLDNLTLSDAKISVIKAVFFGEPFKRAALENIRNSDVAISKISSQSGYDKEQDVWRSRIDLEITRKAYGGARTVFGEYATVFDLPDGCWISDYYLYVGDTKEYGILAEKKAAMWVFGKIRERNQDPGLLHYLTGNKVAFRVFPFSAGETRKTGIEFLHKEPVIISLDGHSVKLGGETAGDNIETEGALYVSARQKQQLKHVKRKPYFHFIIDASRDNRESAERFADRIGALTKKYVALAENARISFVDTYVYTKMLDDNWIEGYKSLPFDGGFYLDRAVRKVLFDSYKSGEAAYPIIVVVTDRFDDAVFSGDFADFKFAFPESDLFFELRDSGRLLTHSLVKDSAPIKQIMRLNENRQVLEYKLADGSIVYLPDNNSPSVVPKGHIYNANEAEIKEKSWMTGLAMQGMWQSQILHPKSSLNDSFGLIKYSFLSKIMMPVTSYIVVENEAQKAMLAKKQKQALSSGKPLDLDEETQRMSEPGLLISTLLLAIFLRIVHRKKKCKFA